MYGTDVFTSVWFWTLLMCFCVVAAIFIGTWMQTSVRQEVRREMAKQQARPAVKPYVDDGRLIDNNWMTAQERSEGNEKDAWRTPKRYSEPYPSFEAMASDLDDD